MADGSPYNLFSKDKALYKSCGESVDGGKTCQKKVMEQGDNQYRCEKCGVTKSTFTWRMILQVNMADASDNVWATCFQVDKNIPEIYHVGRTSFLTN